MNTYDITVDINGKVTFEVQAESKEDAKEMVNNMLDNSIFKELRSKGQLYTEISKIKDMDRDKDMEAR